MAICMRVGEASHIHEDACDEPRDGRTTTVVAVRMPDEQALAVRNLIQRSPVGYASVSEFFNNLVQTQALRKRGTQLTTRSSAEMT